MTANRNLISEKIHMLIANLLPTPGKDYHIKIDFIYNSFPIIELNAITPFGRVWIEYLKEQFKTYVDNYLILIT